MKRPMPLSISEARRELINRENNGKFGNYLAIGSGAILLASIVMPRTYLEAFPESLMPLDALVMLGSGGLCMLGCLLGIQSKYDAAVVDGRNEKITSGNLEKIARSGKRPTLYRAIDYHDWKTNGKGDVSIFG